MLLKVVKNTVLFSITIAICLVTFSCGNSVKQDKASSHLKVLANNDTSALDIATTEASPISVGANRTALYLPLLKGKRVAIVANPTSVIFKDEDLKTKTQDFTHLVDSLVSLKVNVTKVFSPEHGFRGTVDAGEFVKDGIDTKTGLPIVSLYGKNKKPRAEQLKDLDLVIFDIQDVGVRFYTYISTLHYVMEACAELNIPVLILDRPNPNGSYIDGPTLEKEHRSFLGMHTIPLIHGMTIGEYAKMINGEAWLKNGLNCDLTIIPVKNYTHQTAYSLPIKPSPNLPNDQSILLYPSLGLFEGTDINAGRGTEFQFQRYGAPFLDQNHYKFTYTPVPNFGSKHPKHENKVCYGVDLSKVEIDRSFTLKYVIDAYTNATDKSKVFNTSNFTAHAGTSKLQQQIESGLTEKEIKATWKADLDAYKKTRSKYLIYD